MKFVFLVASTLSCTSLAAKSQSAPLPADRTPVLTCSAGRRLAGGTASAGSSYQVAVTSTANAGVVHVSVRSGATSLLELDADSYYDGHATQLYSAKRFLLRADSAFGCWRDVRLIAPLTDIGVGKRVDEVLFTACNAANTDCG